MKYVIGFILGVFIMACSGVAALSYSGGTNALLEAITSIQGRLDVLERIHEGERAEEEYNRESSRNL